MSRLNYILSRHRTQSRTFFRGIGRKVGRSLSLLILGSLFAPDLVWQDVGDLLHPNYLQTLKADGREREGGRETSACIRISFNLEKYHVSVGC